MISPTQYLLPYADVSWQDLSTPYSNSYQDVYWSSAGGADEKQTVFLNACEVEARWKNLNNDSQFTIVETGFGFGLNFLLTLRRWLALRQEGMISHGAKLNFVSFEQHLVLPEDLEQMASRLGFETEWQLLKPHYPLPVHGCHQMEIDNSICLQLIVGDIQHHIEDLRADIDAVFFDGFSPGKNNSMWEPTITHQICNQLRDGALVSSYTVAGDFRRGLERQGLTTQKPPGFGGKRHMLIASKPGKWQPNQTKDQHVAIIGGGLAGLFLSAALKRHGCKVTVIASEPFGALNNINQIALYPLLSRTPQPYSNFYLRAFLYLTRQLKFESCGRLELLETSEAIQHATQLAEQLPGLLDIVTPEEASSLLGFNVDHPGLYCSRAGWANPKQLIDASEIKLASVTSLERIENHWHLTLENGERLDATDVVLATGHETDPHGYLTPLNLMPLRGQSLRISGSEISPSTVLSMGKSWFPPLNGESTISGTYDRFDSDLGIRPSDEEDLLRAVSEFVSTEEIDRVSSTGIRSATRDRMPVADAVPDWSALSAYCNQSPSQRLAFDAYTPNLYCSVGYGSHGGTLGPYCAELLARKITGSNTCDDLSLTSSTRFAFRDAGIKPPST